MQVWILESLTKLAVKLAQSIWRLLSEREAGSLNPISANALEKFRRNSLGQGTWCFLAVTVT